jgi:formate dehydrogenase maturation protein FdhE
MGSMRTARRKLKEKNVWIAQETDRQKVKFLQRIVEEKVKKDAEFAKDVLAAVGDNLPKEIKEAAEKTVAEEISVEKSDQHEIT